MSFHSAANFEDSDLLERFKRGRDDDAFEEIARRYLGLMRRTLQVHIGGDADSVEDALQDSLIRLHRSLPSFRADSKLSTYIAGLCRHAAQDEARKKAKEAKKATKVYVYTQLPSRENEESSLDPAKSAEMKDEARTALGLLYGLPEPDRSILYLKDAEGMEIAELRRIFRLAEGTIKSKLFRARDKLRRSLEEAGYGRN